MQPQPLTTLEINSVGPPPVRHADRIVGAMMRHLAKQHSLLWEIVENTMRGPHVRDGNSRAQAKLEARIKQAGAFFTKLEPGKRGRYKLTVFDWTGYDRDADRRIAIDNVIPERPWLAAWYHMIEGKGRGFIESRSSAVLFLTHHCLSRVVQRWQVRTMDELERVIETIGAVAMTYIIANDNGTDTWHRTADGGIRVPFPNHSAVMILKGHEKHRAMVVTTIW
jgi:hypothetical protein